MAGGFNDPFADTPTNPLGLPVLAGKAGGKLPGKPLPGMAGTAHAIPAAKPPSLAQQRHQQNIALLQNIRAQRQKAGKTPAFQPGHSPVSSLIGSVIAGAVNPIMWGEGAIQGGKELGQSYHKFAKGNLSGGAADAGLGALGLAAVLPFGKGPKAALEGLRGVRTAEETAAHVAEAAAAARAAGHGARGAKIPLLKPGEITPETGGELGGKVRAGLTEAPTARTKQAALYGAARSERAQKIGKAIEQGGLTGYHAALAAAKGELPKVDFGGFKQFDQETLTGLLTHISSHPGLRPFEKLRAQDSIVKATQGVVPRKSDQLLLERIFGKEAGQQITRSVPFWKKLGSHAANIINVPRSIMASFDMSAPFRQGLVAGVSHPAIFARNFGPMIKSFGNERFFQGMMNDIYARPTYPLMQKAKLALTDIGVDPHGAPLETREEQFMTNLAEQIPGIGHIVRASDRAYVGFLNKTRADMFDYLTESAAREGLNLHDENVVSSIARFVNSATGRGDLGALQKHAVTLNTLFFSPRLLFSRLNFMNPVYYMKLDPFARQEALKAARNLLGTMSAVMYLAKLGGAKVGTDPRNADFGKIRIGNTRVDLAGGFTQPLRLLAQLTSGKVISSTTGKTLTLGPQGPGKLSRFDIGLRFVEGKLGPIPSTIVTLAQQQQFGGQKLTGKSLAAGYLPLLIQDVASLYQTPGGLPHGKARNPVAGALGLADLFGVGVNSYAPKPPKTGSKNPYSITNTGGGFSDPYATKSGGGGSSFVDPFGG